jgi:hypothetical protein
MLQKFSLIFSLARKSKGDNSTLRFVPLPVPACRRAEDDDRAFIRHDPTSGSRRGEDGDKERGAVVLRLISSGGPGWRPARARAGRSQTRRSSGTASVACRRTPRTRTGRRPWPRRRTRARTGGTPPCPTRRTPRTAARLLLRRPTAAARPAARGASTARLRPRTTTCWPWRHPPACPAPPRPPRSPPPSPPPSLASKLAAGCCCSELPLGIEEDAGERTDRARLFLDALVLACCGGGGQPGASW